MENCIFCKIRAEEIPSYKIYENSDFLVFLDITQLNEGHCLVIPKKHYRWVWDVQEEYSKVCNKVANAIKKAFSTERVVSFVIGDQVPHAHIHLVPRFEGDGHGPLIDTSKTKTLSDERMREISEKIRKEF